MNKLEAAAQWFGRGIRAVVVHTIDGLEETARELGVALRFEREKRQKAQRHAEAWERRWRLMREEISRYPKGMTADHVEAVLTHDDFRAAGVEIVSPK